ncbi:MAG: CvpA family protein [Emergencia sp.]|nr:CvpA family protein [Emergencia sp.]
MADIVVIVIILASTILGAKKGFSLTVISFMQWFVCLILGVLFCSPVKGFYIDYTTLDESILSAMEEQFEGAAANSSAYQAMPDLFSGWLGDVTGAMSHELAASVTSILLTIISFLTIVIGIKVVCFLLSHLLSKKHNDGIVGFFDGFMGFIFGAVRGLLLVFLFFTILVPLLSLVLPDFSAAILTSMDQSRLAHYLYEENILLILVRDLIG